MGATAGRHLVLHRRLLALTDLVLLAEDREALQRARSPPRSVPRRFQPADRVRKGRLPPGRVPMRELSQLLDQRIAVLDGAWGTMLQGAGSPRPTTAATGSRPSARRHRRPGPAQPDPARRRPRRPPAVSGRRRRHHHDQHVHRDQHRPGRLRAAGPGPGDEPARRPAGPAGRRRGRRAVRRRFGRPAERDACRCRRRSTTRPTGRSPSTRCRPPTPSRSRRWPRAAWTCC